MDHSTPAANPRRDSLPPLDLLRGFEAVARRLSFSRAAEDLFVTQSAVSRQIAALEEHLGVRLFERAHRTLTLTDAGRELFAATEDALENLRLVARRLRAPLMKNQVTLTTTPGFASLWLIPRLGHFASVAPGVDVRISVSLGLADLEREEIDVAVRYCSPNAATGRLLFEEEFLPVCSPSLIAQSEAPLREIDDLERHTFLDQGDLEYGASLVDWSLWLRAVDRPGLRPARRVTFSQYDAVIAAALAGQGVAIGRLPIIDEYLADGRLIAPFASAHASTKGYVLMESGRVALKPAARAFCDWLVAEASATGFSRDGRR
jgi:LysR family transcriptional regulator, glycine cleavage system transcriptional activator